MKCLVQTLFQGFSIKPRRTKLGAVDVIYAFVTVTRAVVFFHLQAAAILMIPARFVQRARTRLAALWTNACPVGSGGPAPRGLQAHMTATQSKTAQQAQVRGSWVLSLSRN